MQNQILEPMGRANPNRTCMLNGTGPGLPPQESVGQVVGCVLDRIEQYLQSKYVLLAGHPDPLLIVVLIQSGNNVHGDNAEGIQDGLWMYCAVYQEWVVH